MIQRCWKVCSVLFAIFLGGVKCDIPQPRLSLAEWTNYNYHEPQGPGTYAFGYDIEDPATNNIQFRNEERHPNGTVTGSYGYVEPGGNVRIVHYIADHKGYRVTEESGMRLSMLKPIRFPVDEDHHVPIQQIQDHRIRPVDRFGYLDQIYNAPQNDLYEPAQADYYPANYPRGQYGGFPHYSPEFPDYNDPRRFY